MRRTPLTLEEHKDLGAGLYRYSETLSKVIVRLSRHYPKTNKSTKQAWKVWTALQQLRCDLDSQLAVDHPEDFTPTTYYPGQAALTLDNRESNGVAHQ